MSSGTRTPTCEEGGSYGDVSHSERAPTIGKDSMIVSANACLRARESHDARGTIAEQRPAVVGKVDSIDTTYLPIVELLPLTVLA